ncbi:1,2-phenylacetyl-CoA epoxidase subunit PaaD [Thermoflavimicrobium daqui]|uniref:Phenylacetate-CoA oxygenase subunit PaaJ n=1 Tax=Thermoflavimicrobium daqui TaxID=2137476 RepID=A0A364K9I1_9BACL|nr:1,2-phenylacetyl-CoA epoxidase subunit PaaD [Thermoflavimicrobium daqui]RAL26943.1 phenylacetate-CoA oxygenase subunit PaaJ [Thermoflavimicrobium daqui]
MRGRWWEALQDVKDPEIPSISIVEMGMVHQITQKDHQLLVEIKPTFMGCPALDIIRERIESRLLEEEGIEKVEVRWITNPPWTSDCITTSGRERLKEYGIAPPPQDDTQTLSTPACPYCNAKDGEVENLFGPTACRAIYYCKRCKQPFEGMKRV